jgi:hypothetical protein
VQGEKEVVDEVSAQVWIAKVVEVAKRVDPKPGKGQVQLRDMKLIFYKTKGTATKRKEKGPIYRTMYKAEDQDSSTPKKRVYIQSVMEKLSSLAILKVFDPSTYLAGKAGDKHQISQLMSLHVEEAVNFTVVQERYGKWLVERSDRAAAGAGALE